MAGWLNYYNLKCQPVDYSDGPMSKRVRVLRPVTFIGSKSLKVMRHTPLQSVFELITQRFFGNSYQFCFNSIRRQVRWL